MCWSVSQKAKKCLNSAQKSILKLLKGAEYVKQCSKFEKTCPAKPGQAYLPYTISNNWLSLAVLNAEVQYISITNLQFHQDLLLLYKSQWYTEW